MKNYELTYLISPDLSETEVKSLQEKISSLIGNKGGVLVNLNTPTKKKLAYPIKKRMEAYLSSLNFQLSPDRLIEMEKDLKVEENVLRFLIITKKIIKKVPEALFKKPPRITKPKKVELKEIEQKLEEILG
jgi:small subunit ribosomal protein S6